MIPVKDRRHPLTGKKPVASSIVGVRHGGSTGRVGYFGKTRNGGSKQHNGVDFLSCKGQPVYAAHDGVIIRDGEQAHGRGYGLRLCLLKGVQDGSDTETRYAHLSGELVGMGVNIRRGVLIGWTGDSGNVEDGSPDHLHFEVRVGGSPVDPLEWLKGKV